MSSDSKKKNSNGGSKEQSGGFASPSPVRRGRRFSFSFSSKSQRIESSVNDPHPRQFDADNPLAQTDPRDPTKKSFSLRGWLGKKKKEEEEVDDAYSKLKTQEKEKPKEKEKEKEKSKDDRHHSHHHHHHSHQSKHHHKHSKKDSDDKKKKKKSSKKPKSHDHDGKPSERVDSTPSDGAKKETDAEKEEQRLEQKRIDSFRANGSFVFRDKDNDESSSSSSTSLLLFSEDSFESSSSSSSSTISHSSSGMERSTSNLNDLQDDDKSPSEIPLGMTQKSNSGPLLTVSGPPELPKKIDESGSKKSNTDTTDDAAGSVPLRLFDEHSRAYRSGSCSKPALSQSCRVSSQNNTAVKNKKKIPNTSSPQHAALPSPTVSKAENPPVRKRPPPLGRTYSGFQTTGNVCVKQIDTSPPASLKKSPRSSLASSSPVATNADKAEKSPRGGAGQVRVSPRQSPTQSPRGAGAEPTVKVAKKVQTKTGHKCTCQHLDRHLWLPKCKKCFHPVSCHVDGGACTYVEEDNRTEEEKMMHSNIQRGMLVPTLQQHPQPLVVVPNGNKVPMQQPRLGQRNGGESLATYAQQLLRSKSFIAIPNSQKRLRPGLGPVVPNAVRTPTTSPRVVMTPKATSQPVMTPREEPVSENEKTEDVVEVEKQDEEADGMTVVDSEEVNELRVVSERLANFLGESDDMPHDPLPLARVFEVLVTSTIRASGLEDEQFVKDFLAGYTMALSTKQGYNKLEPLDDEQWHSLQTVGRTLWDLAGQQEFLRTMTYSQAFLATRAAQRRKEATSIWRSGTALKWLHGVIRVRNEERNRVQLLGNFEEQRCVQRVTQSHQSLCSKLDKICLDYPEDSAFTVGSLMKTWLTEAKPVYADLYSAMMDLNKSGKTDSEQAELLLRMWTEVPQYSEKIESVITLYHELCSIEKLDEAVATRLKNDCQLLEESLTISQDLSSTIVKEYEQHKLNEAESGMSADRLKGDRRKSRKKINELFSQLPEPTFLPPNTSRKMQCQGFLLAALSSDDDGLDSHSSHHQFRFALLTDALVLYSKGEKPQAVASMMLKDTVIFPRGDEGFVLLIQKYAWR